MKKGGFVFLLLLIPCLAFGAWPEREITVYNGSSAGGVTDMATRILSDSVGKMFGQPVVVVNKPGASHTVCANLVANAKPDGYTLGTLSSGAFIQVPHQRKVPFDPLKDFTPIMSYSYYLYGLAVRSDSPWKTFEDFIAYAKANPGKIRYSTSGVGTGQHVIMEYLAMKEKIKWTHIPFTASPQAVAACLGGHVEAVSQTPEWKEQVDAGALRLLVCWNDKRMPFYPKVPTLMEKGHDFAVQALINIYGPANTPKTVVDTVYRAFRQAADTEEMKQLLQKVGYPLDIKTAEEVSSVIKKDYENNGKVLKELGLGIYKK